MTTRNIASTINTQLARLENKDFSIRWLDGWRLDDPQLIGPRQLVSRRGSVIMENKN
jgi:hypothetical protein